MTSLVKCILAAGLLALPVVPAGATDPWSSAQKIVVVLVDNRFEPDHLTFHAGQTYELRLENRGKELHEFTAPAFLKAATVRDKRLLSNGGGDVVVQSGNSVSIFLIAPRKGQYDLTCADHDWDGMIGSITVD
jgi:plastocyanin